MTPPETAISELLALEATRLDGVENPANGTPWLLIKSLPTAAKSDSQESDVILEGVTGEKPDGGTCNAMTADGSPCSRAPVRGSDRCHHHQGHPTALKGQAHMNTSAQLKRLEQLFPHLPNGSAAKDQAGQVLTFHAFRAHAAGGGLAKSGIAYTEDQAQEITLAVKAAETEVQKGDVQASLNGTAAPELGGQIASGGSGVSGAATAGTVAEPDGGNGLPGMRAPLLAGQSPYNIPAESRLNGGKVPQGDGQGLAAIVRSLGSQGQELPGEPANPQLVKALEEVEQAERVRKAVQDRTGFVDHAMLSLNSNAVERAGEDLTLAKLRAHAIAQFGGGQFGGQ